MIWSNDIQAILGSYTQINTIGYMLAIGGIFRLRKLPKYKDNNTLRVDEITLYSFKLLCIYIF